MSPASALVVEPGADHAIREINALERRIVESENDADAALWQQAECIVAQLHAGMSQRQLAAHWINLRTGEPYSQMHVSLTARVFAEKYTFQPRPSFRDAYNALANRPKLNRYADCTGDFEHYSPATLIEAARAVLGDIDLDPASCELANTVVKAARFFTIDDDGLTQPWQGRVWMNPPYSQPLIKAFADKLAESVRAGVVTAAVVLVNNTTETMAFQTLARVASAFCFPAGRVKFWQPNIDVRDTAGPPQGQAVLYVGPNGDGFCKRFAEFGFVARIAQPSGITQKLRVS
jgi:DNA N-6-adenine-methyltransferase (Dam)